MAFQSLLSSVVLSVLLILLASPAHSQIITNPCTPTMISSFTPCMSFVTNSSSNGTSPTSDCCNSLQSLMRNGKDCLCLIATGSVPFQIPINRTLAISLPRACNMPGVPLQCKAAGAPVPAPGPAALGPTLSPNLAPSPSSKAPAPPEPLSPTSAPAGDATPAPPTPPTGTGAPTSTTGGNRAGVTPSAAQPSHNTSPLLLLGILLAVAFKYY